MGLKHRCRQHPNASRLGSGGTSRTIRFEGDVDFRQTTFKSIRRLGYFRISGNFWLDGASFWEPITISLTAKVLFCNGTHFAGGGSVRAFGFRASLSRHG